MKSFKVNEFNSFKRKEFQHVEEFYIAHKREKETIFMCIQISQKRGKIFMGLGYCVCVHCVLGLKLSSQLPMDCLPGEKMSTL